MARNRPLQVELQALSLAAAENDCRNRYSGRSLTEEVFRDHLRRRAAEGDLAKRFPEPVVALGEFWLRQIGPRQDPCQLDAVALLGHGRKVGLVGEAKWTRRESAGRELATMQRKVASANLTTADRVMYVVGAREQVTDSEKVVAVTAADIFG